MRGVLFVILIGAANVYQCTITHLIHWHRVERKRLQYQIDQNEKYNQQMVEWAKFNDPKITGDSLLRIQSDKCVYWGGNDITLNEAKEMAQGMQKEHDRLLAISPFNRIMSSVFE